jgi:predicted anti-sigma-YlaC factor YlaD
MTHLSSDQIAGWTLGERNADVKRHLEHCSTCHGEVSRLQDGLEAFRETSHVWAERAWHSVVQVPLRRAASPVSRTWIAASIVTASIVLGAVYVDVRQAQVEQQSAQDSLLLNEVHERLMRSVPQSMESLMALMNEKEGDQQ